MRVTILLLVLVLSGQTFAEMEPFRENYTIDSVKSNTSLASNKANVIVTVKNANFSKGEKIQYGYDGKGFEGFLNGKKSIQFILNAGNQSLQFYPPTKVGYEELLTLPIQFNARTTTYMTIEFQFASEEPISIKKPVIYFYPREEIQVTATVHAKGELSFTYPSAPSGTWEFTANPSGELGIAGNSYNYLFWEAEQEIEPQQLEYVVATTISKEHLLDYLEANLDAFGFNSKEKMDFITFWAPQLLKYEATSIQFLVNESCSIFADLEINPKPDNLLRFYMVWSPSELTKLPNQTLPLLHPQDRSGFTVLEWGGMEIPSNSTLLAPIISFEN